MNITELISAGIDVDDFLNRIMQNTTLVKVFITKFLEDGNFDDLVDAIKRGDMKSAEGYCHTLKGMCGNMSLLELFRLLQAQLDCFRSGEYDRAISFMPQITVLYMNATNHMRIWLSTEV